MRALLEYLGIVGPDRTRREPVALPAWVRWVTALVVAVVLGLLALASTAVLHFIRSLVS